MIKYNLALDSSQGMMANTTTNPQKAEIAKESWESRIGLLQMQWRHLNIVLGAIVLKNIE
jgi:hypothetical protein